MKIFDTNLEQAAEESERDRLDLAKLRSNVAALLKHDDIMRVPVAVQRLVDNGVDPVVVAKTLLIGSREGGKLYELSTRAPALSQEEAVAEMWVQVAIRDSDPDVAATMLVTGAVWLATQFKIDRDMLAKLVTASELRVPHPNRAGYGCVDLVDNHGVGDRGQIVQAIKLAKLPDFAPLEYRPS